ncbi:MAG: glycosyltransferase family 1 protein [Clostridiales bacterium]|nr:glycosyltransferase family 1 protein [Clostridiales bacterium]
MKRLLCILSGMNAGGAETFLIKVYRRLDKDKYQMDFVINSKDENFYEKEINSLGGKVYRIPSKSQSVKLFKEQLTELVKENKYEYVLRITSNAMGFMDLKIAKKAGAKICSARSSNSSDGGGIKAFIAHRLGRILYNKYVDVKFAPSDLAAEYTFGKTAIEKGKATILRNAVDLNVFHYDEVGGERVRKEFNISEDKLVIGHIGRFMTQKNHSFLLDIFNEICKEKDNAVLMLVGKGELEQQIKDKISALGLEDKVIFTGVRADIPQILSAMDVFVFPSFYEGMPNTVIEAQATGLPCVIADTITKEADITGLVNYLSLNDSAKVWAEKALSIVEKERRDTKADFIKNGYDIESVVKKFTQLVFGEKK